MDLDLSSLTREAPATTKGPFTILVVCTGNICRSAFAAALLESELKGRVPFGSVVVESAGTDVAPSLEMPPLIREAVLATGADPDSHRVTPLQPAAAARADLIITMTRRQRAEVARRSPRSAGKTVTLAEFDRLLSAATPASDGRTPPGAPQAVPVAAARALRESTAAVLRRRGLAPRAQDEDVVDPWQRPDAVYAEAIARIRRHVGVIVDGVAGMVTP